MQRFTLIASLFAVASAFPACATRSAGDDGSADGTEHSCRTLSVVRSWTLGTLALRTPTNVLRVRPQVFAVASRGPDVAVAWRDPYASSEALRVWIIDPAGDGREVASFDAPEALDVHLSAAPDGFSVAWRGRKAAKPTYELLVALFDVNGKLQDGPRVVVDDVGRSTYGAGRYMPTDDGCVVVWSDANADPACPQKSTSCDSAIRAADCSGGTTGPPKAETILSPLYSAVDMDYLQLEATSINNGVVVYWPPVRQAGQEQNFPSVMPIELRFIKDGDLSNLATETVAGPFRLGAAGIVAIGGTTYVPVKAETQNRVAEFSWITWDGGATKPRLMQWEGAPAGASTVHICGHDAYVFAAWAVHENGKQRVDVRVYDKRLSPFDVATVDDAVVLPPDGNDAFSPKVACTGSTALAVWPTQTPTNVELRAARVACEP